MRQPGPPRLGMTLVELLTVITILTILMAVAIPVMRPALKDRKLREASRQLNTYISVAKAKAAETGRPHGITIIQSPTVASTAYQVFVAETPIPFAGETLGETAKMYAGAAPAGYAGQAIITDSQSLVKTGDYIRFNFKGPKYYLTASGGVQNTLNFAPASGEPWPRLNIVDTSDSSGRMQFQVFRQPVLSGTPPLQLPTGTVIDLQYSGVGYDGTEMAGASTVTVMFTPSGGIDRILGFNWTIPGTLHLLVGRVEQAGALETDTTKLNIVDGTASWISIGHQTGTVTTAENYFDGNAAAQTVRKARTIAQTKQTMGGR